MALNVQKKRRNAEIIHEHLAMLAGDHDPLMRRAELICLLVVGHQSTGLPCGPCEPASDLFAKHCLTAGGEDRLADPVNARNWRLLPRRFVDTAAGVLSSRGASAGRGRDFLKGVGLVGHLAIVQVCVVGTQPAALCRKVLPYVCECR